MANEQNDEDFRSFSLALDRAFELFRTCPDREVQKWFKNSGQWEASVQSDVGNNRRADLVNGFRGRVGGDGPTRRNLTFRLDWDPTILSHINVVTVNNQGGRAVYHLTFRSELDPTGMQHDDSFVNDLMQRLDALVGSGTPIAEALDRIRSLH